MNELIDENLNISSESNNLSNSGNDSFLQLDNNSLLSKSQAKIISPMNLSPISTEDNDECPPLIRKPFSLNDDDDDESDEESLDGTNELNKLSNANNDSYLQSNNSSLLTPTDNNNLNNQDQVNILQKYLNDECFEQKEWEGSLLCNARMSHQVTYSTVNLLQFIGNKEFKSAVNRIYFCHNTYPVLDELNNLHRPDLLSLSFSQLKKTFFKSQSFQKLSTDIVKAGRKSGYYLNRSGVQCNSKVDYQQITYKFVCRRNKLYKQSKNLLPFVNPRRYTYHNDKKNQRKFGRKQCRRRNTNLPLSKCDKCNFHFLLCLIIIVLCQT